MGLDTPDQAPVDSCMLAKWSNELLFLPRTKTKCPRGKRAVLPAQVTRRALRPEGDTGGPHSPASISPLPREREMGETRLAPLPSCNTFEVLNENIAAPSPCTLRLAFRKSPVQWLSKLLVPLFRPHRLGTPHARPVTSQHPSPAEPAHFHPHWDSFQLTWVWKNIFATQK